MKNKIVQPFLSFSRRLRIYRRENTSEVSKRDELFYFLHWHYIKFILLLISLFCTNNILSAQNKNDVMLIQQQLAEHTNNDSTKHFSLLVKKNPLLLPFTTTLYFYQNIISPQLATECPHIPSCSNFSKQCIAKYGFVKGIALSADRLTRCSPISIMDLPSYSFDYFTNKINDLPIYYYFKKIKH